MASTVTRRDAIRRLAVGGAATAALPLWAEDLLAVADLHAQQPRPQAAASWTPKVFDTQQNETVVTLSELIIPETDTPGAKAAKVNEYIDSVLADSKPETRDQFLQGLTWLDEQSQQRYNQRFVNAAPERQVAFLTELSTATEPTPDQRRGVEFFRAIRAMTIAGYYTSEIGLLQEIGDPPQLFFAEFTGCTHPEHR